MWPWRKRQPRRAILVWRVQHHSWLPEHGENGLIHVKPTSIGTFEIYERAQTFLLSFPPPLGRPAELFDDLSKAKEAAQAALAASL